MIALLSALFTIAIHTKDVLAPPPKPPIAQWTAAGAAGPRTIILDAKDGTRLRGWLMPSELPDAAYVIFFYGSNEDLLVERNRLEWLTSLGVNALCIDYRGYGFSDGVPTTDGVRADALDIFDMVRSRLASPDARIFVYGWSVGTQLAIHVAANRPVAGVILQAPPASADAMDAASRKVDVPGIARWAIRLSSDAAVRRLYQGASEAEGVTAPLLVISGSRDTAVPPAQARQVFDAARSAQKRLVLVDGADHNRLPFRSPPTSTAVETFLNR